MTQWKKNQVCQALEVSRFSLYYQPKSRLKMGQYNSMSEDSAVLQQIKAVLDKRRSYGYKRVTALVNKERLKKGLCVLNKKRIYRIMKRDGLLFARNSYVAQSNRSHTGKVMTLHSNTRWCSDCFEIHCFNGEKVYVSFILDCHDRECIAYKACFKPLIKRDIQEVMVMALEKRFKAEKAPRVIEFLTDRGSVYRSEETIRLGRLLGLRSCFTAPYSPQSNGMAEAFVKTIKRDYVYVNDCDTAQNVAKRLKNWIFDYNNEAPHSGLGMKSPVEYQKLTNLCV